MFSSEKQSFKAIKHHVELVAEDGRIIRKSYWFTQVEAKGILDFIQDKSLATKMQWKDKRAHEESTVKTRLLILKEMFRGN